MGRSRLAELGAPAAQMYAYDVDGDGDQRRDLVVGARLRAVVARAGDATSAGAMTMDAPHDRRSRLRDARARGRRIWTGTDRLDIVTGKRFLAHNGNDPGEFDPIRAALVSWRARLRRGIRDVDAVSDRRGRRASDCRS